MTTAQHGGASVADGVGNNTTGAVYPSEYLRQWTPSLVLGESNENSTKPHDSPIPLHEPPKIVFAMAQPSGVTEEGLIKSLKEKIGATHVDIEDMSGLSPRPPASATSTSPLCASRHPSLPIHQHLFTPPPHPHLWFLLGDFGTEANVM